MGKDSAFRHNGLYNIDVPFTVPSTLPSIKVSFFRTFIITTIIIIIIIIIINGIFTQDNPSVESTVINGVLLTNN